MAAGHVYILLNAAMPGLVKIGSTTRTPAERAKELSQATGIPTPFVVAFDEYVGSCEQAEREIHARLDKYRASSSREFFTVPLKEAIQVLVEVAKRYPVPVQSPPLPAGSPATTPPPVVNFPPTEARRAKSVVSDALAAVVTRRGTEAGRATPEKKITAPAKKEPPPAWANVATMILLLSMTLGCCWWSGCFFHAPPPSHESSEAPPVTSPATPENTMRVEVLTRPMFDQLWQSQDVKEGQFYRLLDSADPKALHTLIEVKDAIQTRRRKQPPLQHLFLIGPDRTAGWVAPLQQWAEEKGIKVDNLSG